MAHELDITNGVASFAAHEDAWHRLGTILGRAMTAEEALEAAHLARWNVRKLPLTATETVITADGVTTVEVPVTDKYATVRKNPITGDTDYLGVVGSQYTPVQNEQSCELLNALVDESGAHFETAGALRGGRETFVTMRLPEHLTIGGVDPIELNIAALNSHDGSSAFRFLVTPVRIVCANTQAAAIKGARSVFSARHTVNVSNSIQKAREVLGLTFQYVEAFEAEAERMIQEQLTAREFEAMIRTLWPVKDEQEPSPQWETRRDTLMGLFESSPTTRDIRGTAWAGYQTVTEYIDHYAPVHGDQDARALRALTPDADRVKARAFDLVKA